jgi:hypothetical protein
VGEEGERVGGVIVVETEKKLVVESEDVDGGRSDTTASDRDWRSRKGAGGDRL